MRKGVKQAKHLKLMLFISLILFLHLQMDVNAATLSGTMGKRDWRWPMPGSKNISSCFPNNCGHGSVHHAIDISGAFGLPIYASYEGTVLYVSNTCNENYGKASPYSCPCGKGTGCLGKSVYLLHNYNGVQYVSRYGHMQKVNVNTGDVVTKNTIIGENGSTGASSGAHLDFTIWQGNSTSKPGVNSSMWIDPFLNQFLEKVDGLTSIGCSDGYLNEVNKLYSKWDNEPPVISDVYWHSVTETGYTVHCTVTDNNGLGYVQFPTWTDGPEDLMWGSAGEVSGSNGELNYRVNIGDHNNKVDCWYHTDIYCYDAAGNLTTYKTVSYYMEPPYTDQEAPVISDVRIVDMNETGYSVVCTVTDNAEVTQMRVAAGPYIDEKWEMKWIDGTIEGNTATVRVNAADFDGVMNCLYATHIYAYDAAGNETYVGAPWARINEKMSPVAVTYYGGHTYELYDIQNYPWSWSGAESYCESIGAHLVSITSQQEQNVIMELTEQGNSEGYWIGGNDRITEGVWEWSSGEVLSYTNWQETQPDNWDNEDYMIFMSTWDGKWNDTFDKAGIDGAAILGFICEKEGIPSYSITYHLEGGINASSNPNIYYGTTENLKIADATKPYHEFLGWYTAETGGEKFTASTICNGNLDLYARWKPQEFTIVYDVNGGKEMGIKRETLPYSDVITFLPSPEREGYCFMGWSETSDGQILMKQLSEITRDYILYAQWAPNVFCVTLDVNGGKALENTKVEVCYDGIYGALPVPTREGYIFEGWFTEVENGIKVIETSGLYKNETHTLYAHWNKIEHVHEYSEKVTKEPSCAETGIKTYTCDGCKDIKTEVIPKTAHSGETYILNEKEATTLEEGYTGDVYCKVCDALLVVGKVIPTIAVDENSVTFTVNGGKVTAGKEITVTVDLTKNTGIAGFSYDVNYDEAAMTLTSVSAGDVIVGNGQISTNGNIINWYTSDNVQGNGSLLKLVFAVSSDAQAGNYPISISLHDGKKNLVDENGTFIEANYIAGQIEVATGILGDLNGDDDITMGDVVLLNRHVLGKTVISNERLMFADVNGDNDVTIGDVVLLNRHVLGKVNLFGTAAVMLVETGYEAQNTLGAAPSGAGMKIYAEDISIAAGATVDIPVMISGNTGLAGLALSVNVPAGYTLNSIQAGSILTGGTFTANGPSCTWYAADNIAANGVLMTLNVTASAGAKGGYITIGVKDGKANNLSDEMGMTVAAAFGNCGVTIEEIEDKSECEVNGHSGGTATCISQAVCGVCGENYGETDAANHTGNTEVRDAKDATATEAGYTGDTYCKDCGEKLQSGSVIPVLGTVMITAGDVTVRRGTQIELPIQISGNTGIAGLALTVMVPDGVALDEIVKGNLLSEGTFSTNGNTCTWYATDNLSGDGTLMILRLTIGEAAVSGTVTVGLKDGKANNLSDELGRTVAATFQQGIFTVDTRSECEINGHKGGMATCKEQAVCSVCKNVYGDVDIDNHVGETEIRNKVEASCSQAGYTGDVYCADCEKELTKGTETEKAGHSWNAGEITIPATCTAMGEKTYCCLNCSETRTEEVEPSGHGETEVRNAVAGNCTEAGYTGDVYCKECGSIQENGVIIPAGHKWNDGSVTQAATCTVAGVRTYKCLACSETKTENVPATGHSKKTVVKNKKSATCSKEGYTGDTCCSVCQKVLKAGKTVKMTAHKWDKGKVTKAAAPLTAGEKVYTCSACKLKKKEVLKATGPVAKAGSTIKDTSSNAVYKVAKNGVYLELVKLVKTQVKTVTVPATVKVNGYPCPVTSIGANAFKNNKTITKVTIGANVTSLGSNAFSGCTKLATVSEGNNVVTIGAGAFNNCTKLKTISISAKATSIGAKAFYKCTSLTKITLPAALKQIGDNAFDGCKKLTTVTGGKNLEKIGNSAFANCTKLKNLTLGENVTSIGSKAFYKCTSLAKVTLGTKVKSVGGSAFDGCKKLKAITVKTTLLNSKNVGKNAFKGTYAKAVVSVPKKLTDSYKKLLIAKGLGKKAVVKAF